MYHIRTIVIIVLLLSAFFHTAGAAERDTSGLIALSGDNIAIDSSDSKHSPPLATILSAVVPGAGQIYNRKYWKVPLIYAGFGTIGFFAYYNGTRYNMYKKTVERYFEQDSIYQKGFVSVAGVSMPVDNAKAQRNEYRRYRDLNLIIMGGWYILNIIDANVDAHFFDYDISDDLTIRWQPELLHRQANTAYWGATLSVGF